MLLPPPAAEHPLRPLPAPCWPTWASLLGTLLLLRPTRTAQRPSALHASAAGATLVVPPSCQLLPCAALLVLVVVQALAQPASAEPQKRDSSDSPRLTSPEAAVPPAAVPPAVAVPLSAASITEYALAVLVPLPPKNEDSEEEDPEAAGTVLPAVGVLLAVVLLVAVEVVVVVLLGPDSRRYTPYAAPAATTAAPTPSAACLSSRLRALAASVSGTQPSGAMAAPTSAGNRLPSDPSSALTRSGPGIRMSATACATSASSAALMTSSSFAATSTHGSVAPASVDTCSMSARAARNESGDEESNTNAATSAWCSSGTAWCWPATRGGPTAAVSAAAVSTCATTASDTSCSTSVRTFSSGPRTALAAHSSPLPLAATP
mmetsp:Transcript_23341/g.59736  ORF Transcript_23341/g.59736 Transcript_23341/m.59736 type:complete len:376 (+) Transcript_23341:309-1436(+)